MDIVIETDRLLLRSFTQSNAHVIYGLNLNADETRYTRDPLGDPARTAEILEKGIIPQYALYNLADGQYL